MIPFLMFVAGLLLRFAIDGWNTAGLILMIVGGAIMAIQLVLFVLLLIGVASTNKYRF
jgi:hypothetical protein